VQTPDATRNFAYCDLLVNNFHYWKDIFNFYNLFRSVNRNPNGRNKIKKDCKFLCLVYDWCTESTATWFEKANELIWIKQIISIQISSSKLKISLLIYFFLLRRTNVLLFYIILNHLVCFKLSLIAWDIVAMQIFRLYNLSYSFHRLFTSKEVLIRWLINDR